MTIKNSGGSHAFKPTMGDRVFVSSVYIILVILGLIFLIPMLNVTVSSFSSPKAVGAGKVSIFPIGFNVEAYKMVFANNKIVIGFTNTIIYTFFGTLLNIVITVLAAYPMSREDFAAKNIIMKIFTFTMYFSGGIIPTYLLYKNIGFINSRLVMIVPGALSVYNMIVMRTFLQTNLPNEILEAAQIDGCSDFKFLSRFVVPLSMPIIAVIIMFYAIGHWNSYFDAYVYLSDESKYPLSIFIQTILGGLVTKGETVKNYEAAAQQEQYKDIVQYALIIVTCLPVWICCPFMQKYFVQGVMVGSVKG